MDAQMLRELAFRSLRIAELTHDLQEAGRLRLAAASYLEQAAQQDSPAQQQQQIQTKK
jgi:hypothetical protein